VSKPAQTATEQRGSDLGSNLMSEFSGTEVPPLTPETMKEQEENSKLWESEDLPF